MELPLKNFNLHNHNIDRLRAEEDMRLLRLLISYQNSDSVKSLISELSETQGTPAIFAPKRDADAMERLKQLGSIR